MRNNHPKLTTEAFARIVELAIARIPEEIRRHLENILISVKQQPDTAMLEEMGLAPDEPLFGIYWGIPLTERSLADPPLYPDTIYIFQQPLEAFCTSRGRTARRRSRSQLYTRSPILSASARLNWRHWGTAKNSTPPSGDGNALRNRFILCSPQRTEYSFFV